MKLHCTRKPNTANWVTRFPEFLRPHIRQIIDVPGDGHCGYTVIANYLGLGDDGWKKVRLDLLEELKNNHAEYNKVLSLLTSTEELIPSVDCVNTYADVMHWMTISNMGNANKDILTIGYINGSHFVRVELVADSPLPSISKMWLKYSHRRARYWRTQYIAMIDKFRSIMATGKMSMATVEIID
ncbi:uncharacterized protein LOC120000640 [Tripterygium wilfordii]|uniref:uncharacterized protein LOC120000640 n=1 Tax=Tripterygium wilfordii TaxID=458696 RepID=UPI0018F8175D|nr:uncharacterized protein LOC120000640 [Tripterygium wilfordii]